MGQRPSRTVRWIFFFLLVYLALPAGQAYTAETSEKMAAEPTPPRSVLRLSLADCIRLAIQNNLGLSVARFAPQIALTRIEQERAAFDPVLLVSLDADRSIRPSPSTLAGADVIDNRNITLKTALRSRIITGAVIKLGLVTVRSKSNSAFQSLNPSYETDLVLTYSQPLLRNFGVKFNTSGITLARNNKQISVLQLRQAAEEVVSGVQNAYWGLIFARESLQVAQRSLNLARDLLEKNRTMVEVGVLAPVEVLQAEAGVAAREEGVIIAQGAVEDAEDVLKRLLNVLEEPGQPRIEVVPTDEPPFIVEEISGEENYKIALENRSDRQQALLDLQNRDILTDIARNQLLPQLDLVASAGLNGLSGEGQRTTFDPTFQTEPPFGLPPLNPNRPATLTELNSTADLFAFRPVPSRPNPLRGDLGDSLRETFSGDNYSWSVGLVLEIPLGNSIARSEYTRRLLEARQSSLALQDLELQIQTEVRRVVRAIEANLKRVKATRVARNLAEEKLAAEEKKFDVGLSTSFDVLTFQEDLAEAQQNELRAIIDYNTSLVELDRVTGQLLQRHRVFIEET